MLLIVKINEDFEFEAKLIDRRELVKGKGKRASVSWACKWPNKLITT
jgi:hypothetical protein